MQNASDKRERKGCDWLLANDTGGGKVFGQDKTSLYFITDDGHAEWNNMLKTEASAKLVENITKHFNPTTKAGKFKNTNPNIRIAKSWVI